RSPRNGAPPAARPPPPPPLRWRDPRDPRRREHPPRGRRWARSTAPPRPRRGAADRAPSEILDGEVVEGRDSGELERHRLDVGGRRGELGPDEHVLPGRDLLVPPVLPALAERRDVRAVLVLQHGVLL